MPSYEQILAAKEADAARLATETTTSYAPGHLGGFNLFFEDDQPYIGPGAADVYGNKVKRNETQPLSECTWVVPKVNRVKYSLYIDRDAVIYIDIQPPEVKDNFIGAYHPSMLARYLGSVYVNSVGRYLDYTVATFLIVGYSGEGTPYTAEEGDKRIVIEADEQRWETYTAGAWVTAINISNDIPTLNSAVLAAQADADEALEDALAAQTTADTALSDASDAQASADFAQATADGKIQSFYQTTAPSTGMSTGDLWIDTDDGNTLYRYSGSAWVEVQDDAISTAITNAATAQSTADGKVTTFYQDTIPTAEGTGDMWYCTGDVSTYEEGVLYRWSGTAWNETGDSTADRIEPVLANFPGAVTIGFESKSGSSTYLSPEEGDRRVYIDGDEIRFEEYTGGDYPDGDYSTVNSVKFGGVDSNGVFISGVSCRQVVNPLADTPSGEVFPEDTFRYIDCESSTFEDQNGDEPDSNSGVAQTTTWKKFGTYSAGRSTTGAPHYSLSYTDKFVLGNNIVIGTWFRATAVYGTTSVQIARLTYTIDASNYIIVSLIYNAGTEAMTASLIEASSGSAVQNVTVSKAMTTSAFTSDEMYLGLIMDMSELKLNLIVNNSLNSESIDSLTITGAATTNAFVASVYDSASTATTYMDDILFSYSSSVAPDILLQHYQHNVPWNTDYSAKDLALIAADGGYVKSNATVLNKEEGWHVVGDTGEPAFQNSWTSYNSASFGTIAFRKDAAGTVHLRGTANGGSNATVIFTLPEGYRPQYGNYFSLYDSSSQKGVFVYANGDVLAIGLGWLFLAQCNFTTL